MSQQCDCVIYDGMLVQRVGSCRLNHLSVSPPPSAPPERYSVCSAHQTPEPTCRICFLAPPEPEAAPPQPKWKAQMHYRVPHTFRSGCGVSSKGGIHWTTDIVYVTCPECVALSSPLPSEPQPALEVFLASLKEAIVSLKEPAERIAASDNTEELRTLWRGKAIAYDVILGLLQRVEVDSAAASPVSAVPPTPARFTENEIKDVLTALYQDGHVDLVLADRIAALMGEKSHDGVSVGQANREVGSGTETAGAGREGAIAANVGQVPAGRGDLRHGEGRVSGDDRDAGMSGDSTCQAVRKVAELLAIRERLQCLPDAKILDNLQSLLDDRDVAWQRVNAVTKDLHQAQAENRELWKTVHEQLSGWQPIETAPKDGTEVLLCWFDGIAKPICHVGHNLGGGRRWQNVHQWLHNEQSWPTLWRPLPALPPSPPAEKKNE